jgi:plasmid stabilization system protein ParE
LTRLLLAPAAWRDVERLAGFLLETDPLAAAATAELLVSGLSILRDHPLAGRRAEHGLRELMISRGRSGCIALYRYDTASDTTLVLALRHQRELA